MSTHTLTPLQKYRYHTSQWNIIFGLIPKITYYFGDTYTNFYSFVVFLGCSPEVTYKIRLTAHKYGQSPFLHLFYLLFETAPTLDHFVHTLFECAKQTNSLQKWIDYIIIDTTFPKIFMSYVDLYTSNHA